jgi:hypothetical protein
MLAYLVSHFSILLNGVIFCAIFVAVSVGLALLIHRFVNNAYFEDHNEQAGFIFAVIGVVYAVLLAFVAIGVWERFDNAEVQTYDESTALVDVYRDATVFPQGAAIRASVRNYTNLVIDDEWLKMNGGGRSASADRAIESLARDVNHLTPRTLDEQDVHASMLSSVDRLLADRASRLSMGATGLSPIVWAVLGGGAVVTVAFSFLFPFKRRRMQVVMVGALALSIAMVFYLTSAIDYPFHGDITVQPHAFENAIHDYADIDAAGVAARRIRGNGP